ncbi:MAG: pyridoxal phosphate-dependent aminotransferase [Vicinamibacterales bacterium]
MSLSRRTFLHRAAFDAFPAFSTAFVTGRGREAFEAEGASRLEVSATTQSADYIWIHSNENPLGPGPRAIAALTGSIQYAGRYPMNARPAIADLRAAIAARFGVKPQNVVLGAGSGEILRNAVRAFTSPARPLVTAAPSFEAPERMARQIGTPVKAVPVDGSGRLDIEGMAAAARGAGLVFFCNPNNPTATVHGAKVVSALVARVRRESPDTAILVDEAYHDYVTDPGYATAAPLALEHAKVFITRTFSKAYGMAGLRSGYAIGQLKTIEALAAYAMPYNQNALVLAAAVAALGDTERLAAERARNTEVRAFTTRFFESAGCKPTRSEGNFVFADLGRPAKAFREACGQQKVMIGREFPPLAATHVRISLGTMEEMQRAAAVFRKALAASSSSAPRG